MQRLGPMMRHVHLASRMAKAVQADLVGAHADGRLSQADWAGMIRQCRGCDWASRCPDWLDRHPGADCAPRTCPNAMAFARIRSGKRKDAAL